MIYNGVNFYPTDKTEADFVAHESHHGLTTQQLKEAYGLLTGKKKKVNNPPVDTGDAETPADNPEPAAKRAPIKK